MIAQKLDNHRISSGHQGNRNDSRLFMAMRDELRAVHAEWYFVFSDEDNDREYADFNAKQAKPSEKVKKHASQNRF